MRVSKALPTVVPIFATIFTVGMYAETSHSRPTGMLAHGTGLAKTKILVALNYSIFSFF